MHKTPLSIRSIYCTLTLALLAAAGLAGCTPTRVASLAAKIADFDVPEGYSAQLGIEADGYILVGYTPGTSQGHLYLFQAPPTTTLDADELQTEISHYQPGWRNGRTTVVGTQPIELRGQQVSLVISEGTNSDGKPYREYTAVFQGLGGPALVSITTVEGAWDEAEIMNFLATIQ